MQTKDDGTHVILPVADALAVSSDHARLPVMMLRHADGKMRRDGSSAARPQPSQPVAERGGLHGAPELSAVVERRTAAKERRTFSAIEERRRWRRRSDSSHRLGRQDKAGSPAAVATLLRDCLHVVFFGDAAPALRDGYTALEALFVLFSMVQEPSLIGSPSDATQETPILRHAAMPVF